MKTLKNRTKDFTASIVIPNYNGEKLLEQNLPGVIAAFNYKPNRIKEVIVIDDGSKDASVKVIHEKFPEVRLIKHRVNRGFSAAVNTGARMAYGSLIVLLNSDVYPENNFLEHIFSHFEKNETFAVSFHEVGYGWAKGVFRNGFIEHEPGQEGQEPHITFWVNGGTGIFRRTIWMKLGGMDEKLFSPAYWEDLDLSYRAAKRGYGLFWEPKAKVYHQHEATLSLLPLGFINRVRERNQLLFIWKNLTSTALFRKHLIGLFKRIITHPGYLLIFLSAIGFLGKVLRTRRIEIKEAKISDEAIFNRFK